MHAVFGNNLQRQPIIPTRAQYLRKTDNSQSRFVQNDDKPASSNMYINKNFKNYYGFVDSDSCLTFHDLWNVGMAGIIVLGIVGPN